MIATDSLSPQHYFSEQTFQQEQINIFKRHWFFVGFTDQLSQPHDFITTEICGLPVVVQNFDGELSALLNICSHRKARLQTATSGNRPLRCPYHCWSFKKDGQLAGVPQQRTEFDFSEADKTKLALKKFHLASCGSFLFVRIAAEGPTLAEFLGPYAAILQQLSGYFSDPVHQGRYDWQTNWKLAVETVLEVYHVAGVHPESFSKLARAECEVLSNPPHNIGNTPLQETPQKWWQRVRKQLKLVQHPDLTEYNHFFIYPNLAIGLTNGSLMSVQTYEPVTSTKTVLNFRLRMISTADGPAADGSFKRAVLQNFIDFNHQTLEEDRIVAESCQQNMPYTEQAGILGRCEDRIRLFHQAWQQDMEKTNV
jgi:phenylpropionate dioxygenase-like ring-hydroxylating dioxygenase large terminal subunit